jgi:hypothetical protein
LYIVTLIKIAKPVTIVAKDQALESFIKQVLKGQQLKYSIQNKTIFISKNETPVLSASLVTTSDPLLLLPVWFLILWEKDLPE